MLQGVVDTSSWYTLVQNSTAVKFNWEVDDRRTPPVPVGVTGSPFRILRMVFPHVMVGQGKVTKQWFPVMPDNYLSTDLLLGCNVLRQATHMWDHQKGILSGEIICTLSDIFPNNTNKYVESNSRNQTVYGPNFTYFIR